MKHLLFSLLSIGVFLFLNSAVIAQAPVCYSLTPGNLTYTQDFDTLSNSGRSSSLPTGIGFAETGSAANSTYTAGSGSSSTSDTYSFGSYNSTDRAFGGLQGSNLVPIIGGCFTNNTGAPITAFTLTFDGEQWRLGQSGQSADRLDFQYSANATGLTNGTWTDANAGDFSAPITTGNTGSLNGNLAANRTAAITVTVSSLDVTNGSSFYIRWTDLNISGSDSGLAIDNLSLTASASSPGTVQFHSDSYTGTEDHGSIPIVVNRLSGSYGAASVAFATSDGTGVSGPACDGIVDYIPASGTIEWVDGDRSDKTFDVIVCDDAVFEGDKTVNLTLTNVTGAAAGQPGTASLTILEADATPSLSFADSAEVFPEAGGTYTATVYRSGASGNAVTVNYSTLNGSAVGGVACGPGVDFVASTGTLSFGIGVDSQTFPVTICNNSVAAANMGFSLNLQNPTGGAVVGAVGTQTVTIVNDDVAGVTLTQTEGFTIVDEVNWVNDTDTYTIVLNSQPTSDVTITIPDPWDLVMAVQVFTFTPANWSTPQTVTVTSTHDTNYMGTHYSLIQHVATSSDPGYNGIPIGDIDVTILDQQPGTTAFNSPTFSQTEGFTASVEVARTGDITGTTTVDYYTADGTATGGTCGNTGVDYQPTSGTLVFGIGEVVKTVNVVLCTDMNSENPAETIIVNLTNVSTSGLIGAQSDTVLYILDAASQHTTFAPMTITGSGAADVYPAILPVSGYQGLTGGIRVTLYGVTTASPETLRLLLVSPGGRSFVLMSNVGGSNAVNDATLTFEDAATDNLPDSGAITDGKNYRPTTCGSAVGDFPGIAPVGPYYEPGCSGTPTTWLASVFAGINPNGDWQLYAWDNSIGFSNRGSNRPLANTTISGWGIDLMAPTAASSNISGRIATENGRGISNATVELSDSSGNKMGQVVTGPFGYYTFENVESGRTYVVTVRSGRYDFAIATKLITVTSDVGDLNFVGSQTF